MSQPTDGTRPYLESELNALKKTQLIELVLKEIDKWPHKSKTAKGIQRLTREAIIGELTSEANKFCTSDPVPHAPQTNSCFQSAIACSVEVTPQPPTDRSEFTVSDSSGTGIVPGSINIAPPQQQHQTRKRLALFVNDARQSGPLYHPQSAEVVVLVHPDIHDPHESRFHARELMCELQKSNAKVEGHEAVTISHQHHLLNGYQVTFAKNIIPDDYSTYLFNPDMLVFPSEAGFMFLNIYAPKETELVNDLSTASTSTTNAPANGLNKPTDSKASLSTEAAEPHKHRKKRKERDKTVIDWIRKRLVERPALQDALFNHRNVLLQNAAVVQDWDMIQDFISDFTKKRFPEPNGAHKISRADIYAAVGYSSSWFDDVAVGHRLVHLYGQGGPRESQAVIEELETAREPAKGKTTLLTFLKQYDEQQAN